MAAPASAPQPNGFAPDRLSRNRRPDFLAIEKGNFEDAEPTFETAVVPVKPAVKNASKKRKAESEASAGSRKSSRVAAKTNVAAKVPKASVSKRKAPAKKPSKAALSQETVVSSVSSEDAGDTQSDVAPAETRHAGTKKLQGGDVGASQSDSSLSPEPDKEQMEELEQEHINHRQSIPQLGQAQALPSMPTATVPAPQVPRRQPKTASGTKTKVEDPPGLIVRLKVPPTLFTKKKTLKLSVLRSSRITKASSILKTSTVSKPSPSKLSPTKTPPTSPDVSTAIRKSAPRPPKTPRNSTHRAASKTPRAPAARKPSRASALPTPPAEIEELDEDTEDLEALIDPKQLRLSRKLVQRSPIASKPAAQGSPEVWADSRQALCETVPYFKMPQSGCHQNDGHVYAFLYDGAVRCREYMDTDLIISGAGGGMEADSTGSLVQKKNHTMDEAQVKAVLNDIEHKNPLVVICGNKSEGALCKMPYRYNVLGWFKPTAVWAEKTMGKKGKTWTTIRYRFERLDSTKAAWNTPQENDDLSEEDRSSIPPLLRQQCQHCSATHPLVYLTGWMCLSPDCPQFWKLPNGKNAPYGDMHFNPAFLLERTDWAVETEPFSVKPPVLSVGTTVGDNLTQINTRGMCCPNCGRCNSRRLFKGWKCENAACAYENFPKHIPVKIPLLHQPWETTGAGPMLARNKHDRSQGVGCDVRFKNGFKVYRYSVPGVDGALIHLVSNTTINKLPGGADDMFDAMQREDLHLERRRFGVEKMSGGKVQAKSQAEPSVSSAATAAAKETLLQTMQTPNASQASNTMVETQPESAEPSSADIPADVQRNEPQMPPAQNEGGDIEPQILPAQDEDGDIGPQKSPAEGEGGDKQRGPSPATAPAPSTESEVATKADIVEVEKKQDVVEDGDFMTAFSMNYGMPYKFVANGASLPFQDSPWPVRAARADLNWASQTFLDPEGHEDLNEELIFAYMEGQKLEYHDDGEEGLGPRIATLSLGGKARMHLRMKMKHYTGCSKTGLLTKERPVPGSIAGVVDGVQLTSQEMYEKRLAAWEELQLLTDRKEYNKRAKEIPVELGLFEKRMKKADDMVTVTLNHGDIVLMEGYDIQKYLEHKVVPEQCLRFALTCRTILPDHLKPEERPSYGAEADEEEMSALRKMVSASGEEPKEN